VEPASPRVVGPPTHKGLPKSAGRFVHLTPAPLQRQLFPDGALAPAGRRRADAYRGQSPPRLERSTGAKERKETVDGTAFGEGSAPLSTHSAMAYTDNTPHGIQAGMKPVCSRWPRPITEVVSVADPWQGSAPGSPSGRDAWCVDFRSASPVLTSLSDLVSRGRHKASAHRELRRRLRRRCSGDQGTVWRPALQQLTTFPLTDTGS
jgi:hypothetical protein